MNSQIKIKIIHTIIIAMKLAKYFDEILNEEKKVRKITIVFDDMVIFNKGNEKRIEVESLLLKQMKFLIIINLQLIKTVINTELSNEEINEICYQNLNEIFIPFLVFLIRNMSSLNEEVKRIETIYKEEEDYNQIEKKKIQELKENILNCEHYVKI